MNITKKTLVSLIALSSVLAVAGTAQAQSEMTASKKASVSHGITQHQMANAKSRLPMLTDRSQIPGISSGGFESMAYGTGMHPFTTKRVALQFGGKGTPTNMKPYRRTGKLWMRFGASWFVCTASVIDEGVLVTAAHCVHSFGDEDSGFADEVLFEPALHGTSVTFGTWDALEWFVPPTYFDGTDVCTVSGIVCENDIAVVVMDTGPAPYAGMEIADVTEKNSYYKNSQGFTSFSGMNAAQITQLGYPVAHDAGLKMVRTDSLGYKATPSNVIIGSAQTGGSSGGPWIMNFGKSTSFGGTPATGDSSNRVTATTSWGYVDDAVKVQGASHFANNTAYPSGGPTNIASLLTTACTAYPAKC